MTPSSPPSTINRNARILIVEDVIYNQTMLKNMLEILKYNRVETADNGYKAFEMMKIAHDKGEPYSILLLDLRMPVMDGFEVINEIKKHGWSIPRIVVVTASVMDDDRNKCKELGVQYFITKPIAISQLKDIMLQVSALL